MDKTKNTNEKGKDEESSNPAHSPTSDAAENEPNLEAQLVAAALQAHQDDMSDSTATTCSTSAAVADGESNSSRHSGRKRSKRAEERNEEGEGSGGGGGTRTASEKNESCSEPQQKKTKSEPSEENAASDGSGDKSEQLVLLMERLRSYHWNPGSGNRAVGGDAAANAPIDETRARYLLEASAGNLDLAVMLYWEDLAVTSSSNMNEGAAGQEQPVEAAASLLSGGEAKQESSEKDNNNEEEDEVAQRVQDVIQNYYASREEANADPDARRARPRLSMFARSAHRLQYDQDQSASSAGAAMRAIARHIFVNANARNNPSSRDTANDPAPAVAAPPAAPNNEAEHHRPPPDPDAAPAPPVEPSSNSVSISDDEANFAGVAGRLMMQLFDEDDDDNNNDARRAALRRRPSSRRRRSSVQHRRSSDPSPNAASPSTANQPNNLVAPDAALSPADPPSKPKHTHNHDHDQEDFDDHHLPDDAVFDSSPLEIIWGKPTPPPTTDPASVPQPEKKKVAIPSTWLSAGFTLSSCATGLVAPASSPDDPERSRNRNGNKNTSPHCAGVTALLSIVTALIQSGVSIQGKKVSCNLSRPRFSDLKTPQEKRRHFETRLVDALSSLLFVAASAKVSHTSNAARNKQNLLRKVPRSSSHEELTEEETMKRKRQEFLHSQQLKKQLSLFPVCAWDEENASLTGTANESRPSPAIGEAILISKSNIRDFRPYVLSRLRSFTSPGGIALFLETLVRIHGVRRIHAMLRAVKADPTAVPPLINCTCSAQRSATAIRRSSLTHKSTEAEDIPSGRNCVSTELISLLLTGRIHTSFEGWATAAGLGIGVLGCSSGNTQIDTPVSEQLMHPSKSVWFVRGENFFSTLWLKDLSEEEYLKTNPSAFKLVHWNPWNEGCETSMRIIPARQPWSHPSISNKNESLSHIVSADEHEHKKHNHEQCRIAPQDLENISFHPDDQVHYPKQYTRWRFCITMPDPDKEDDASEGDSTKENDKKSDESSTPKQWIPYYRLDARQKLLADHKHAPRINTVIWSRWPRAVVDEFSTSSPPVM